MRRAQMVVILAISVACALGDAETVTFNKDVAPILFRSCAPCHRPGEGGPFPLLTFDDARRHASQIVSVTRSRYMPPWLPDSGYGEFSDERRLSAGEIGIIAAWVEQGAREGNRADLPALPHFESEWQLGPPDLILRMPAPYKLRPNGRDVFRNFVLPIQIAQTKFVRAFELRPGNKRIVHHANIFVDHRRTLRARGGADGQPGFDGMDLLAEAHSDSFEPDSHFLFWKPGTVVQPEPEGLNWRLDPDADLVVNMHLQPSGKEELIQPEIGLYFSNEPPKYFPMLIQLEHDGAIEIPAGSETFEITDHITLPVPSKALAIYPHAHFLGKRIEAWAVLPDGQAQPLLRILDWNQDWQAVYRYREPLTLPKGTRIEMRIAYDNSSGNARNPHSPPVEVKSGPRSEDEMGHVWLQLLPELNGAEDGRVALQQAMMDRRLEKYPGDFAANCNLGALLAKRKDFPAAATRFSEALIARPTSATARNGLGAALLSEGKTGQAIFEFEKALADDPLHANARWNLAHALAMQRDLNGAAAQLQILLLQQPQNVDAQAGLAGIYILEGRYDDALPHLREASRLRPDDPEIRMNLGALLAQKGELGAAIENFRVALKQKPDDETARKYLAQAEAGLANKR
jgi:Flp pilus assembly protein TadD